MKIGVVIDSLSCGGSERQALNVTAQLAYAGCETELIYYHKVLYEYDIKETIGRTVTYFPRTGWRVQFLLSLMGYLKSRQFDVVHAFKSTESIYGCLAAYWAGVPVIFGGYRRQYREGPVIRLAHRMLRSVVDGWIVNSQSVGDGMRAAIGATPDEVFVVYNGVDGNTCLPASIRNEVREGLGIAKDDQVIIMIGRLHTDKNHGMFLDMASLVHDIHPRAVFLVVGHGPLQGEIEARISELALERTVRLLGLRTDVSRILRSSDVSVLTSRKEGMPNVVLESMGAGVPVVSTNYPGVEEVISHGGEGYIVSSDDAREMAEAVCRLIENPGLRAELGECGRRTVSDRFGTKIMAKRLIGIYESCLQEKTGVRV